jgi:hypothetical protein
MAIFRFPESMQFLLSVGRDEDAIATLAFITASNGKPPKLTKANLELVGPGLEEGLPSGRPRKKYKRSGILALFSTRKKGPQILLLLAILAIAGIAIV